MRSRGISSTGINNRDDAGHPYVSAEQGMFLGALDAAIGLAEATQGTQWKKKAKTWKTVRTKLQSAIHRQFWDRDKDLYADSLHADGSLSAVSSQPRTASSLSTEWEPLPGASALLIA